MRIAIGSDHAGFPLKAVLVEALVADGHDVVDLGTHSTESVDYPIFCAAVGRAVATGRVESGIVLGGSGQGEQLAANKVAGVRAALCNELYTARMSRSHNNANVLSMGARVVADALAIEITRLWLATPFDGGRHQKRIDELTALEASFSDPEAQDAYLSSLWAGLPESAHGADQSAFEARPATPVKELEHP
ncbi:MAG: ribose 5-phosphate isomerase B [Actinobacteria bacterium]|nr:ribose 5-phosphate isomerase B [Actinomycetota bacterium]